MKRKKRIIKNEIRKKIDKKKRYKINKKNKNPFLVYFINTKRLLKLKLIKIIIIILFFLIWIKDINKEIDNDEIRYKGNKINRDRLIEDYISRFHGEAQKVNEIKNYLKKYLCLPEYNKNDKKYYKNLFMKRFPEAKNKTIDKIEIFYVVQNNKYGNSIVNLNNAIFYCEILECHEIILKDHDIENEWPIKNPVYIKELNITITLGSNVNCSDEKVLCQDSIRMSLYSPSFVKPEVRTQYIKEEIFGNIPKVKIDSDDLYIHIRGGDIFSTYRLDSYAQPPLCFYEKIINKNKFKNIYIISVDRQNIVLNALINKYNKIIYKQNDYKYDISLLAHAFNIVVSVSSFAISAIKFNNNLKKLWEYDIAKLQEKIFWLHHHLYKFEIKYKIYTMKPSEIYFDKMFIWKASQSQIELMLKETCPYDFEVTKPNK